MKNISNTLRHVRELAFLLTLIGCSALSFAANLSDGIAALNSKKYDVAFPIFLENAIGGNVYSQGVVSMLYLNGGGVQKNYAEASRWANLGSQKNDANSFYVLGSINQHGLGQVANSHDAIVHFKKSAELGNAAASFSLGQIYSSSPDTSLRNFNEALKFFNQSLDRGYKPANREIGVLYTIGGYGLGANYENALPYLETAYQNDPSDKWIKRGLVDSYTHIVLDTGLFKNINHSQRERANIFIKELGDKDDPYWYYYAMKDAWGGYKRPFNKQLALELTMLGIKKADQEFNTELVAQAWILFNDKPFKENRYLHYAWFYKNYSDGSDNKLSDQFKPLNNLNEAYKDTNGKINNVFKKYFDDTEKQMTVELNGNDIAEIRKIKLNELADKSLAYLVERRGLIGDVEPTDYLSEGMRIFDGNERRINEPLAQHLTEESLRLAIRIKDQETIDAARNNLGVMLLSAVNSNVRNERLAIVHLMDGINSSAGANNILWWDFRGGVQISSAERLALRERYRKVTKFEHPTTSITPLTDSQKSDPRELDKLIQLLKISNADPIFAEAVAQYYEQQINVFGIDKAIEAYKDALVLAESARSSRNEWGSDPMRYLMFTGRLKQKVSKLSRVKLGDYEKGTPDTVAQISQIFKNVETIRGIGKSVELVANAGTPTIKKGSRLRLHALVIGNSNYKISKLNNSVNDAKSISDKLRKYGFDVTTANNLDRKAFIATLLNFSDKAKDSDVTIMFYGGHGMQKGGQNYLLPIDIDLDGPEDAVTYEGISLNDMLRKHMPGKSKVIFLDACRTQPFKSSATRGHSEGLAPLNAATLSTGTLISFATIDGGVAYDGAGGSNSPYTSALVKIMDKDEDIEVLLREVRDEVMMKTSGKQAPSWYGQLSTGRLVISRLFK